MDPEIFKEISGPHPAHQPLVTRLMGGEVFPSWTPSHEHYTISKMSHKGLLAKVEAADFHITGNNKINPDILRNLGIFLMNKLHLIKFEKKQMVS